MQNKHISCIKRVKNHFHRFINLMKLEYLLIYLDFVELLEVVNVIIFVAGRYTKKRLNSRKRVHVSVSQMADGHIIQYEQEGAIVQEQVRK